LRSYSNGSLKELTINKLYDGAMHKRWLKLALILVAFCLVLVVRNTNAHGGVVRNADLCLIKIGYLEAHFKIYLPRTRQQEEFCEDLPEAAESVFVMEYMRSRLGEMPIDFRIIRDVTGLGRFAQWEDVALIEDLNGATVFYQPAIIEPDVFTIFHQFKESGWYIGIVTAIPPDPGKIYTAVFPFKVGFTGIGYWPFLIGLMILIQFSYWHMSGTITRWRKRRTKRSNAKLEM
jgi:hypothetical protein